MLAIFIDIVNAFNSLPWDKIKKVLIRQQVSRCLKRVMKNYLGERYEFLRREGPLPAGELATEFHWGLDHSSGTSGVHLVCYADDTLLIQAGSSGRSDVEGYRKDLLNRKCQILRGNSI